MSAEPWSCNHPRPEGFAVHGAGLSSTSSSSVALSNFFGGKEVLPQREGFQTSEVVRFKARLQAFPSQQWLHLYNTWQPKGHSVTIKADQL